MCLRELYESMHLCRERYWNIPKHVRIAQGFRQDVFEWGYSGARVLEACEELLNSAYHGVYPLLAELEGKLTEVEQRTGA